MSLNTPEPAPRPSDQPASWDLVIADMERRGRTDLQLRRNPQLANPRDLAIADMRERDAAGEAKYGTRLRPGNGRDQLVDAFQESLDLAVYLRTSLAERHDGTVDALYDEALTIVVWLRAEILRRSGK